MNKKILALAVPNIISNITIPLLGMVDLAIVGRLDDDALIGGIAIGGTIFNFLYWNFSFLRMGTSGFTAQAYGARRLDEAARTLIRALSVALCVALLIWGLQVPVARLAMWATEGSPAVKSAALDYFFMRIWAAPATLSMYAFTGWFIGMQNSRIPMWISIGINVINITCSLLAVKVLHMGIQGVALGTVIAQWSGVAMALFVLLRHYRRLFPRAILRGALCWEAMARFFKVNSDIFLRTICLVAVFTYFTIASSKMGDTLLAVNTLMLQLFTLFSYMMDGFAYAGEALAGRYYGAGNPVLLRRAVRVLILWGTAVTALFTVIYAGLGEQILRIFTPSMTILEAAKDYTIWAVLVPACSFLAFLLDGVMVGITATSVMRNAMFIATAAFFACYFLIEPRSGNAGLWIAFLLYLFLRGAVQAGVLKHRFRKDKALTLLQK